MSANLALLPLHALARRLKSGSASPVDIDGPLAGRA